MIFNFINDVFRETLFKTLGSRLSPIFEKGNSFSKTEFKVPKNIS